MEDIMEKTLDKIVALAKKQRFCISGFRDLWWTCKYMGLR